MGRVDLASCVVTALVAGALAGCVDVTGYRLRGSDGTGGGGGLAGGSAGTGGVSGSAGTGGVSASAGTGGDDGSAGGSGTGGAGGGAASGGAGTGGASGGAGTGGASGSSGSGGASGIGGDDGSAGGSGTGGASGGGAGGGGCVAEDNAAFCSRLGKQCGPVTADDNCATSRAVASCGACTAPQICGATAANACGTPCNSPYGGSPRAIASVVQAEDFDDGGEGCAFHDFDNPNFGNGYRPGGVDIEGCGDSGGGFNVGWIRTGEWLKYTVTAAQGTYDLAFRVASPPPGTTGAFHVEDENNVDLTGGIDVPATASAQTYATVTKTGVTLTEGTHVLKFVVDRAGGAGTAPWNFNYFTATPAAQ